MKIYLIREGNMNGSHYLSKAYSNKKVAIVEAKGMEQEWYDYKVEEYDGEEISKGRVIVDDRVYTLDKTCYSDKLREIAKSKLTKEELEALYSR